MLGLLGFTEGLGVLGSAYASTDKEDVTNGVSSTMLLAGVPQCPSAEQGGGAGEAAELVQAAVGNEQPWKACPGFWSSFTILPEPPQTCPGTALGELCQWCEGWTAWTMLWDFPAHPPGAEGEAGAARAVLCREHKEVCSIVERRSQTCFAADKCTSPSAAFVS